MTLVLNVLAFLAFCVLFNCSIYQLNCLFPNQVYFTQEGMLQTILRRINGRIQIIKFWDYTSLLLYLDIIHRELHCALRNQHHNISPDYWVCTFLHSKSSASPPLLASLMVGMRCCWYTSTLCISLITSHLISATLHHPTQVVALLAHSTHRRPHHQRWSRQATEPAKKDAHILNHISSRSSQQHHQRREDSSSSEHVAQSEWLFVGGS